VDSGLAGKTLLFVLATVGVAAVLTWGLARTRFGLRLRACGEDPSAAHALGIDVGRARFAAVVLGSAVCGLGGVALAFDLNQFHSGMTGGRGFIALAAVIVSGWRPWPAVLACLAFATLDALQIVFQNAASVASPIVSALPFVATLLALALRRQRSGVRAPAGIGKHPV
jgi:simple sugar transport system permease protein